MRRMITTLRSSARQRRASRTLQLDWERQRRKASSPSERAEIDAIFARHIA